MDDGRSSFGALLRTWRHRRRLGQLDLALQAEISQRHLSFLETGRSSPSRDMVLHLSEALEVPLRDRNGLLLAAGLAPIMADRDLGHPDLAAAKRAVDAILRGHCPNPALAVDRHWRLIQANEAVAPLLDGVSPSLLGQPTNVLKLSLHPDGLSRRIPNLRDWRQHLFSRLAHQIAATGDPALADLLAELRSYPVPVSARPARPAAQLWGEFAFTLDLELPSGAVLSLFTATTVFGMAADVTLSELAIETFFPADDATRRELARLAQARSLVAVP